MRRLLTICALLAGLGPAAADGLSGHEKLILPATKANWIAFRNYDGKQFVYFTHLVVYRCGLSEVRYAIDFDAFDGRFQMQPCDPQNPHAIDPVNYPPYLELPLGHASRIAVQVVYADGEESGVVRFTPCDVTDDSTCALLVE
ncbi:MAG: hypothetical protein RLT05_24630 [Bauldia litoralis]